MNWPFTARNSIAVSILTGWTALVVWQAWVTDDAFITLRTVDNALNGFGLRWNISERVQVYTHPLWMFLTLAASWIVGSPYYAVIALAVGCSVTAMALVVWRAAPDAFTALVAALILAGSSAFLDFATSGLENPLTHVLIALFVLEWWRPGHGAGRTFRLAMLTAGIMLNRLDAGLLVLPALVVAANQRPFRPHVVAVIGGFVPLAAWHAFSLVYYGFLFPNTAYAKLATGVSSLALLRQGTYYFQDSWQADTVTLATIAIVLASTARRSMRALWPLSLGILLYLVYILRIGGDFMAGRFFAAPLFLAVLVLCRLPLPAGWPARAAIVLSIVVVRAALAVGTIEVERPHGITDQRRLYSAGTRLFTQSEFPLEKRIGAQRGARLRDGVRRVVEYGAVGMTGFFAGPDVHIIDRFALADPLLARRPAIYGSRIGHFERRIPEGYPATLRTGKNRIQNRRTAAYYDLLARVTQGPLWTWDRWQAIWRLNVIERTM
jgi:arabinofuranosyltransferase